MRRCFRLDQQVAIGERVPPSVFGLCDSTTRKEPSNAARPLGPFGAAEAISCQLSASSSHQPSSCIGWRYIGNFHAMVRDSVSFTKIFPQQLRLRRSSRP